MANKPFSNGYHILVGLGGTGGKILRAFKMRMYEEFPTQEERNRFPVALLYVDSTDEMMPKDGRARADFRVMGQDASFTNNEFLNIKAVDTSYILDHIDSFPTVKGIVNNVQAVKSAIGSLGQAAGQKRRAGRLLFAANASSYVNALRNAFARCREASEDESHVCFHIFAGLSGGTGSGSVVDAIVQTRKTFPNSKVLVYAMMPEMNLPKADMDQGRYYPNGYAAMNELNALQSGRWFPQDVTGMGEARLHNDQVKGVADGLTIYSNVNDNGLSINSFTELPKLVSDYVFARIFLINSENKVNEDIIRAYNFENMDDFSYEFSEAENVDENGRMPVARTKKINSFGIKRIVYPELRVLKHITYTVGESVLYQFKYNNWRESQGFVDEERNIDYDEKYLKAEHLAAWMLDEPHMMLEERILKTDEEHESFANYWSLMSQNYADQAKEADCPLKDLDRLMGNLFDEFFRDKGVKNYYEGKERALPALAKEIRHNIESGLFDKWKLGDVSLQELQNLSRRLLERVGAMRSEYEKNSAAEKKNHEAYMQLCEANVQEWSHLSILQRMVNVGARRYAEHQGYLASLYVSKTRLVAFEFAKKLLAKVFVELGKMDADIALFAQKVNDAIDETERLITAQRRVNNGLENPKGAIVEVCEEEAMDEFEVGMKVDKITMGEMSRQLREMILPPSEFVSFGRLAEEVDVDEIIDAFDVKLVELVKQAHENMTSNESRVLGLDIISQLQQKLHTDDDIKEFASKIVKQSGVYLKLNESELKQCLRNNEDLLSPTNPASINKKVILVSIPSPDKNEGQKKFADKLYNAIKNSFAQGSALTEVTFNTESPRKNEMSIVTISYCYPMRCIDWMKTYRDRYDRFLHTGNPNTDAGNAILLHSEGDGCGLPPLFAVENAAAVAAEREREKKEKEQENVASVQNTVLPPTGSGTVLPPPPPGGVVPPPPPPPRMEPEIQVRLFLGGQQYGPYGRDICKQLVANGQLTTQTLVWMEGMPAWAPAGQVTALQTLFAPEPPVPPLPPTGPAMPPLPPTM